MSSAVAPDAMATAIRPMTLSPCLARPRTQVLLPEQGDPVTMASINGGCGSGLPVRCCIPCMRR